MFILPKCIRGKYKGKRFVVTVMNIRVTDYREQLNKLKGEFLMDLSVCL
jgi:hypothetical protein